jgi:hypothetical protein
MTPLAIPFFHTRMQVLRGRRGNPTEVTFFWLVNRPLICTDTLGKQNEAHQHLIREGVRMRRQLMFGTVFSAALAVAAAAQQPPTPGGQAGSTPSRSDSAQTTVTGCLRSADAKATGTSGSPTGSPTGAPSTPSASSSSRAGGFILTDVSPSDSAAGAATPSTPTGTAGATSSSDKKGYRLTGSSSELSSLVGKRVEITGTLSKDSGSAGAAPGAAPGGTMSSAANLPQFHVTSVKEATGGASCPSE